MIKKLKITSIKYAFMALTSMALVSACQPSNDAAANNNSEQWQPLFNGKDLSGWDIKMAGFDLNENYLNTFVAEDGMIRIKYDNYQNFNNAFGHMYYQTPYAYYKLKFDYRFTGEQIAGGSKWNVRNSGIMLHSQSAQSNEKKQTFPISVEFQLLGGLSDGEVRNTGNVCTPGTAVEMNGKVNHTHCIKSHSKTYDGDQWVHAEAIVMGGESITFNIEGKTVLAFDKPQLDGAFVSRNQKGKDWDKAGISRDKQMWLDKSGEILTQGYIALQAESHAIDFKNIELLNLVGCMDKKANNYKSYFVKADNTTCHY